MTEITRIPLLPIEKGALGKIWLGVAAIMLAAAGLAWAVMPVSVDVETIEAGTGPNPTINDVAFVNYKGMFDDGKVFDQGKQIPFPLQGVVPGFTKALLQTQAGGTYRVKIPSELGYGSEERKDPRTQKVVIPANSDLTFELEVLGFMTGEQFQQAQQQMMMQQQQGGPQAGPQGAPGPAPRP